MGKQLIPHVASTHFKRRGVVYTGFSIIFWMPNNSRKVFIKKVVDVPGRTIHCDFSLKPKSGYIEVNDIEWADTPSKGQFGHFFIEFAKDEDLPEKLKMDFIIGTIDTKENNEHLEKKPEGIKLHNGKIHYPDN